MADCGSGTGVATALEPKPSTGNDLEPVPSISYPQNLLSLYLLILPNGYLPGYFVTKNEAV
jgi:hypothetical protein